MRLTLLHNPSAGTGRHSADALRDALRAAGWHVAYRSLDRDDVARALDEPADLVLAAGGDGAVADVAKRLVGRGVPLAILPLGTANNIARSLGVLGDADAVVAGLAAERLPGFERRRLDVGTARAPWGSCRFVESAGVGLLTALLRDAEDAEGGTDAVAAGRRRLRRVLARTPARRWTVTADGEPLSGDYALVEVLATRYVGPRLHLAPEAGDGGGSLQLALLGDEDRAAFEAYLTRDAGASPAPVRTRRVRTVRLAWPPAHGHLDDEPWPDDAGAPAGADADADTVVEIAVVDAPVEVVVPDTLRR